MINRLREYLEWYLMDDGSPLLLLVWRYLQSRWRGVVWYVRSEWLHVDPFDSDYAMWDEDDIDYDEADLPWREAGHDRWDDYPGLDYEEA